MKLKNTAYILCISLLLILQGCSTTSYNLPPRDRVHSLWDGDFSYTIGYRKVGSKYVRKMKMESNVNKSCKIVVTFEENSNRMTYNLEAGETSRFKRVARTSENFTFKKRCDR